MAILRVCCCGYSVRRGSYGSAVYTLVYFFLFALLTGNYSYHEIMSRMSPGNVGNFSTRGNISTSYSSLISPNLTRNESYLGEVLVPESSNHTSLPPYPGESTGTGDLVIILVDFTCELCGFISSIFLLRGLQQEKKSYLLPWLIVVPLHTAIDTVSVLNIVISDLTNAQKENRDFGWWVFVIILFFLLDLIFNLINVYVFLCVLSQYQEYRAGRGTAAYDALLSGSLSVHFHSDSGGTGGNRISVQRVNPTEKNNLNARSNTSNGNNPCFTDVERFDIWCEDLVLDKLDQGSGANHKDKAKMLNGNGQSRKDNRRGSNSGVRFDCDDPSTNLLKHNGDGGNGNKKSFGSRLVPVGRNNSCDVDNQLDGIMKPSNPLGQSADDISDVTTVGTYEFISEN